MENSALTFLPGTFFQIETKEVQKLKTESLPAEWSQKKYHETDNIKMIPTEVKSDSSKSTTTEWFLIHLFKDKSSFAMFFPLPSLHCLSGCQLASKSCMAKDGPQKQVPE